MHANPDAKMYKLFDELDDGIPLYFYSDGRPVTPGSDRRQFKSVCVRDPRRKKKWTPRRPMKLPIPAFGLKKNCPGARPEPEREEVENLGGPTEAEMEPLKQHECQGKTEGPRVTMRHAASHTPAQPSRKPPIQRPERQRRSQGSHSRPGKMARLKLIAQRHREPCDRPV